MADATVLRSRLNEHQQRHLLATCQYVDRVLGEIEQIITAAASRSPFGRYTDDLSPVEKQLLGDYLTAIRARMLRMLEQHGLAPAGPPVSAVHAIRTTLAFVDAAVEELRPKYMRGFGQLPPELVPEVDGLVQKLQALVQRLDAALGRRRDADLAARLARLEQDGRGVSVLKTIQRIIETQALVEFRPARWPTRSCMPQPRRRFRGGGTIRRTRTASPGRSARPSPHARWNGRNGFGES